MVTLAPEKQGELPSEQQKPGTLPEAKSLAVDVPDADTSVVLPSVPGELFEIFRRSLIPSKEPSLKQVAGRGLGILAAHTAVGAGVGLATGSPEAGAAAALTTVIGIPLGLAAITKARREKELPVMRKREQVRQAKENQRKAKAAGNFNAAREKLVQECMAEDPGVLKRVLRKNVLPHTGSSAVASARISSMGGDFPTVYDASVQALAFRTKDIGSSVSRVMDEELGPLPRNLAIAVGMDAAKTRYEQALKEAIGIKSAAAAEYLARAHARTIVDAQAQRVQKERKTLEDAWGNRSAIIAQHGIDANSPEGAACKEEYEGRLRQAIDSKQRELTEQVRQHARLSRTIAGLQPDERLLDAVTTKPVRPRRSAHLPEQMEHLRNALTASGIDVKELHALDRLSLLSPDELLRAAGDAKHPDTLLARELALKARDMGGMRFQKAGAEYIGTVRSLLGDHGIGKARAKAGRSASEETKAMAQVMTAIGPQDLVPEWLHALLPNGGANVIRSAVDPTIPDPLISAVAHGSPDTLQLIQRAVQDELTGIRDPKNSDTVTIPLIPPLILDQVERVRSIDKPSDQPFFHELLFGTPSMKEQNTALWRQIGQQVGGRIPKDSDEGVFVIAALGQLLEASQGEHGGAYARDLAGKTGKLIGILAPQVTMDDEKRTPQSVLTPREALQAVTTATKETIKLLSPDIAIELARPVLDALKSELSAPKIAATQGQPMVDVLTGLLKHAEGMNHPDFASEATVRAGGYLATIAPALSPVDPLETGHTGILDPVIAKNLRKVLSGLPPAVRSFQKEITVDCAGGDMRGYGAVLLTKNLERESGYLEQTDEGRGILTRPQAAATLALSLLEEMDSAQETLNHALIKTQQIHMDANTAMAEREGVPQAADISEQSGNRKQVLAPMMDQLAEQATVLRPVLNGMLHDAGISFSINRNPATGAIQRVTITPLKSNARA